MSKKKESRGCQIRHRLKKVNLVSPFRLSIQSSWATLRVYPQVLPYKNHQPIRMIRILWVRPFTTKTRNRSLKTKRSLSQNIMISRTPQEIRMICSTTWLITASRALRPSKTIESSRQKNWHSALLFPKSTREGQTVLTSRGTSQLKNSQKSSLLLMNISLKFIKSLPNRRDPSKDTSFLE